MFRKLLLLVVLGFCFALPVSGISGLDGTFFKSSYGEPYTMSEGKDFIELVMNGQEILATNNISVTISEIAGFDSVDFNVVSVASGNVTTCSIEWLDFAGNSHGSGILTSGVATTNFKASNLEFTFYNYKTITNNITLNILIK